MRKDELISTLVVWLVGSGTTALLLRWDRGRLDERQRRRGWYDATLYLAVSGLFFPAPLTFGAHVWVTRDLPLYKRLPLALAGAIAALLLTAVAAELALTALGIEA